MGSAEALDVKLLGSRVIDACTGAVLWSDPPSVQTAPRVPGVVCPKDTDPEEIAKRKLRLYEARPARLDRDQIETTMNEIRQPLRSCVVAARDVAAHGHGAPHADVGRRCRKCCRGAAAADSGGRCDRGVCEHAVSRAALCELSRRAPVDRLFVRIALSFAEAARETHAEIREARHQRALRPRGRLVRLRACRRAARARRGTRASRAPLRASRCGLCRARRRARRATMHAIAMAGTSLTPTAKAASVWPGESVACKTSSVASFTPFMPR